MLGSRFLSPLKFGLLLWICLGSVMALGAKGAIAEVHTTFLSNGESERYRGYFWADEEVYANCDRNCVDLDIYLYDVKTEELVASDTLPDDNPFVAVPYEGEFWVETVMVSCLVEVCEVWTDSEQGF